MSDVQQGYGTTAEPPRAVVLTTETTWSGHLARAAVVLGSVAGSVSVLSIVVGILKS